MSSSGKGVLELVTVGLKNAGKTVFWSVLYGRRNEFPNVRFQFEDEQTIRYLRPHWDRLNSGGLPEATQIADRLDTLNFKVKATANGITREYGVRAYDYPGILAGRGRKEEVVKQAADTGFDKLIDSCDMILVLIDISDDSRVADQLDTLQYILNRVKQVKTGQGSEKRPVAIVFTKADRVLRSLNVSLVNAQHELLRWMEADLSWRGMWQEIHDEFQGEGHRYRQFFPVSCFGQACTPNTAPTRGSIRPRWMHEPIIWALEDARRLGGIARARRVGMKTAGIVAAVLLVVGLIAFGLMSVRASFVANHQEMGRWCEQHPTPKDAAERLERRATFYNTNIGWLDRSLFVDDAFLANERKLCEADSKAASVYYQADFDEYARVKANTPISSWAGFEEALNGGQAYCAADRNRVAGRMTAETKQFCQRLSTFNSPQEGLEVTVKKVELLGTSTLSTGSVSVWVAHQPGTAEQSVVHDVKLNNVYGVTQRRSLFLYVQRGDKAAVHLTIKDGLFIEQSTKFRFGDVLFKPYQEYQVTTDPDFNGASYRVTFVVNCPPLQNLTMPDYSPMPLTKTPE